MSCYWWADTSTGKGNSTLLVKKVSHPGPIGHFRMHCHWIRLRQDVIIFKRTTRRNPAIGNDMGLSGMVTDSIYSPSSMTRIYPLHAKTGLLQVLFAGSCHITRRCRHVELQGVKPCTSTRVHSVRTRSAFNRGVTAPLHRSSPCRYCASFFWFCRLPVPSDVNRKLRPRLPSSSTSSMPKPIPSANREPSFD